MRPEEAQFLILLFGGGLLVWVLFLLPTIIAFRNRHPHRWAILSANLFLGATGIGWAGAFAWAKNSADYSGTCMGGRDTGLKIFIDDVRSFRLGNQPPEGLEGPDRAEPDTRLSPSEAVAEIERLGRLRADGHLSEVEFQGLKAGVLQRL